MYLVVENFFELGAFILRSNMSVSAIAQMLNKRGHVGRNHDAIRNVTPNKQPFGCGKTIQKKYIVGLAVFANRTKSELCHKSYQQCNPNEL